jgi:hypothetical protein
LMLYFSIVVIIQQVLWVYSELLIAPQKMIKKIKYYLPLE